MVKVVSVDHVCVFVPSGLSTELMSAFTIVSKVPLSMITLELMSFIISNSSVSVRSIFILLPSSALKVNKRFPEISSDSYTFAVSVTVFVTVAVALLVTA